MNLESNKLLIFLKLKYSQDLFLYKEYKVVLWKRNFIDY